MKVVRAHPTVQLSGFLWNQTAKFWTYGEVADQRSAELFKVSTDVGSLKVDVPASASWTIFVSERPN